MKRIGMFLLAAVVVLGVGGCVNPAFYTRNVSRAISEQSVGLSALDVIASCDAGDEVVGGGFELTPPGAFWEGGLLNTGSLPTQDNRGWHAQFDVRHMMLPNGVPVNVSAWARCVDLTR